MVPRAGTAARYLGDLGDLLCRVIHQLVEGIQDGDALEPRLGSFVNKGNLADALI